MNIKEWMKGSGVYKVGTHIIGPYTWFLRKHDVKDQIQPLLHICDKDKDPTDTVWVCITGVVRWDHRGWYACTECKQTFLTEDELAAVWEDGKGTGDEYEA